MLGITSAWKPSMSGTWEAAARHLAPSGLRAIRWMLTPARCTLLLAALMSLASSCVTMLAAEVQQAPASSRSLSEWLVVVKAQTKQQQAWDVAHPEDGPLYRGVVLYVNFAGGSEEKLPPELAIWWKATGSAGFEKWVAEGFPRNFDRDHLIYQALALLSQRFGAKPGMFGHTFADPARLKDHYDQIVADGNVLMTKGFAGAAFTTDEFERLRVFAMMNYSMEGGQYWPFNWHNGIIAGSHELVPGDQAPDFILPRLESVLKSPAYSDLHTLDCARLFHSEVMQELLQVMDGYAPIPDHPPEVKAKPFQVAYPDEVTLSAAHGKRPTCLILMDAADYDCNSVGNMWEPLYEATKDRIDWYVVAITIHDYLSWTTNFFKPYLGLQTYNHPIFVKERAQTAKMWCMQHPDCSIPFVLDDMALHAQNAYRSDGGNAVNYLIDKNGVVTMNNSQNAWQPTLNHYGDARGIYKVRQICLLEANIKTLLDHDGVWGGSSFTVTDWQAPPLLEQVKISRIEPLPGVITVGGADGKEVKFNVDARTRITRNTGFNQWLTVREPLSALAVGTPVSIVYEADASPAGRTARLVMFEGFPNDYFHAINDISGDRLVCPMIVTSVSDAVITARLAPRSKEAMRGLNFWAQAGDRTANPPWQLAQVQDFVAHPDQILTIHVDRATEVILNGMQGKLSDIRAGDHLGVGLRPGEKLDDWWPYFIHDYRYR